MGCGYGSWLVLEVVEGLVFGGWAVVAGLVEPAVFPNRLMDRGTPVVAARRGREADEQDDRPARGSHLPDPVRASTGCAAPPCPLSRVVMLSLTMDRSTTIFCLICR